jgi:lauroyl/myristoyl acyltransferase
VPVIPALMSREADGSYHSRIFAPISIEQRGSRAETLQFYSQQIADRFASVLGTHPEQWYQFVPLTSDVK